MKEGRLYIMRSDGARIEARRGSLADPHSSPDNQGYFGS